MDLIDDTEILHRPVQLAPQAHGLTFFAFVDVLFLCVSLQTPLTTQFITDDEEDGLLPLSFIVST